MPVYSQNPQYTSSAKRWKRCRDAAGGTDAVKHAHTAYLPMLEGQIELTGKGYQAYLNRALFYPAMSRTIQGLLGLVFGKPVSLEKVPSSFDAEFKDVTLSGVGIADYARILGQEVLTTGRSGILVDMPAVMPVTAKPSRPYWVTYAAESIVNWEAERINGTQMLTRVVLNEWIKVPDPDDEFVPKLVEKYRVLLLIDGQYLVRIYTKNEEKTKLGAAHDEWIVENELMPLRRSKPLSYIPFVFCNADGVDPDVSHPPLLDLADVNFSHYRTSADQEHGAHYTALPTPVISGYSVEPGTEIAIGSGTAIVLSDPNARATMLEFTGAGLKALADLKEEKRQLMVTLGARMLETQKNIQEAATTVAMRHAGERSALAVLADALGQALTTAIRWHLYWDGVEETTTEKVTFSLNPEVMDLVTADDIKVLVAAWQAGAISHKTLYANLEYGEWTRQNVDFEEEEADIADEQPELPAVDDMGNPIPAVVPVKPPVVGAKPPVRKVPA